MGPTEPSGTLAPPASQAAASPATGRLRRMSQPRPASAQESDPHLPRSGMLAESTVPDSGIGAPLAGLSGLPGTLTPAPGHASASLILGCLQTASPPRSASPQLLDPLPPLRPSPMRPCKAPLQVLGGDALGRFDGPARGLRVGGILRGATDGYGVLAGRVATPICPVHGATALEGGRAWSLRLPSPREDGKVRFPIPLPNLRYILPMAPVMIF